MATGSSVTEYAAWLRSSLSSYETLAKTLVKHKAEKGRIVESVVKSALRSILPGRFNIGTGFAITSSGRSSSQLDLVIYDALYNCPIMLEGGTALFPIECIYGFVEVKSRLDQAAIKSVTKAISGVRRFAKEEKRYVAYGRYKNDAGKLVVGEFEFRDDLSPRSFVFAINSPYADIRTVEVNLARSTRETGAHVHGLAVIGKDWFIRQRPHKGGHPDEFVCREGEALSAFCASVLTSIQSMQMHSASMRRYLGLME
jgi:Domain of unknown function (DUF6602)